MKGWLELTLLGLLASSSLTPALADSDNLNFNNFGNWGRPEFTAQFQPSFYVNQETSVAKLPTRGTATYNGSITGGVSHYIYNYNSAYSYATALAGSASVGVDFANKTTFSSFTNLTEKSGNAAPTPLNLSGAIIPTITVPGTITGNTINGSAWGSAVSADGTNMSTYTSQSGKFYGPNGAAVAGTLSHSYTYNIPKYSSYQSTYVSGTFGATKH